MPFSLLTRLRPQRAGQLFYLGLATVLLLGGLATWWLGESASRQAKRQLLDQTIGLAHALNTKLVNSLPFDGTDQDLPAYQRIRNQFIAYGRVCGISQIWSETRRDGHLLFGPENLPPGSPMASKPGTVYQRPSAGNLAVSDIFDASSQAHDARSQFLNWALVAHGAWDFAADARGYTWGAALEYHDGDWAVRAGRFLLPAESNGLPLDTRIFKHYGDQVEVEHHHAWFGQPGTVRVLAFRDRARMGSFRDALAAAAPPDVGAVRRERSKTGFGLSLDQAVAGRAAMFARASRNDGQSETYAFAEIERSLSVGATVQARGSDTLGIALVRNGLSRAHRDYLAAGGIGAFIGDGRLDYHAERIAESYYKIGVGRYAALSLDWQHIANPAYNGARGPVDVYGVRLHGQY